MNKTFVAGLVISGVICCSGLSGAVANEKMITPYMPSGEVSGKNHFIFKTSEEFVNGSGSNTSAHRSTQIFLATDPVKNGLDPKTTYVTPNVKNLYFMSMKSILSFTPLEGIHAVSTGSFRDYTLLYANNMKNLMAEAYAKAQSSINAYADIEWRGLEIIANPQYYFEIFDTRSDLFIPKALLLGIQVYNWETDTWTNYASFAGETNKKTMTILMECVENGPFDLDDAIGVVKMHVMLGAGLVAPESPIQMASEEAGGGGCNVGNQGVMGLLLLLPLIIFRRRA